MYHFIVNLNSKSNTSHRLWQSLETELNRRGVRYKSYFTQYAGHAANIAEELCAAHAQSNACSPLVIVTAGGDGTANEVLNGIPASACKKVILGFLPIGSGNDLATALGIPSDPFEALNHILSPRRTVYIDHGMLYCPENSATRRFHVSSGIGYDADICLEASTTPVKTFLNRLRLGRLIYLVLALKQIFTHRPLRAKLVFDGANTQSGSYLFITAMNAAIEGGGMRLAPHAKMNDRKLSVCAVRDFPRIKILILLPALFFGLHTRFSGIDITNCSSVEIFCKEPATTHADGEFSGRKKHIRYSCAKEQIRVIL